MIKSLSEMRILFIVLAAFGCLQLASPASAQLKALLPAKPVQATAPPANVVTVSDPKQELADAQARLADAQVALSRLQVQVDRKGLSSDARNDLLKQFNLRQTLVDRYAQQVDYLKQLQLLEQKIADAKKQRANWTPPAGSAPWPVIDGDVVRTEMLVYQSRVSQLGKELASVADQLANLGREKADTETKLRQLQEAAEKGRGDENRQLENLRASLSLESAVLLRTDLSRRVKEKERTLFEIQLETVTQTWNYYDGRFDLAPQLLANAKADLQAIIDKDRDAELKALDRSELALTKLNKAQSTLLALEQSKAEPAQLAQARAALDIAQAGESAARSEVDRLRQLIEMGGYALQVWDARAEIYGDPKPDAARIEEIAQRVNVGLVRIRQARDFLQQSLTTKEQEAFDLREASLMVNSPLDQKVVAAKLMSATAQTDASRSILAALDKFEQFLIVLQSELGVQAEQRSIRERVVGYWQRFLAASKVVWHYELFTVDDLVVADGKEIKTTRSVTVGKSVGAIGILVLGFFMVSRLIRASLGLAERRLGLKSSVATIIRRWMTVLATGTLIVLSLNLVQIPLSVFAFLGGALAIGVGFGTQNLLKNLISGVMLLVERPIRIGDLVQIDDVRGRVTSIGIRFSTIHSSDGIDTLIPNSELVEKKLTNWTFTNPDVRREIRVGVAYGADPVQVKNLMQSAAKEHPDVMIAPEPMVVLDDLGDNALIFTLRYWIRIENGTDGRRVDSDLRCEILEKLNAAGIAVPFPQREIRLTASEPLPVSVVDHQTQG
jgi:potassium efflux system protein